MPSCASSSAWLWPPPPTVASTTTPSASGSNTASTSASITGSCWNPELGWSVMADAHRPRPGAPKHTWWHQILGHLQSPDRQTHVGISPPIGLDGKRAE
jgi:hypothetical protein